MGLVSQETYLFHATVRENLRFAKPHATDEEIEQAARAAHIHETLAGLPDGYDIVVGQRGYRFSGGRSSGWRSRESCCATRRSSSSTRPPARWTTGWNVPCRPNWTPGGAPDHHQAVHSGKADQIAVLEHGRIVERGTHEELLALDGRYATLVRGTSVGK